MQANTYRGVIVAAVILLGASGAQAASGTWTSNGSGNWSDTTRWTNAIVADGSGFTAEIGTVNITAHRTVTLDSSRTIGNLRFGDRLTNSHDWILSASGGSVLTLAVASGIPAITVTNRTLTNNVEWAGTQGAGKYGTGTLVINSSNTFAGGFLLNRGQVNVNNRDALGVDTVTVTTSGDATRFVLAGGVNITNALVINANNPSAGNGTIMGPASANTTGTWSGPITVNNTASGGGHFLGGTGVLRLDGSVNAAATVQLSHRAGVLVMAGGGSAPGLTTTGTLLPGANDGLPTNAVLWMGGSAASTLDLNGYNQQLDGLTRNPAQPVLVTNTAGSVSTLTLFTTAPTNVVFNGPIAGNISVVKAWSGTQVLSGTNTYNGDTLGSRTQ